jgi:hypothetical protein
MADLFFHLSNTTFLLLLSNIELLVKGLSNQPLKDLPNLLQVVNFLKIDLIKLVLDDQLDINKNSWYLISESLPDDVHGLIELFRCFELLEFLLVLILDNEVKRIDIVQDQG